MPFRADESANRGFEAVKNYLIPRGIDTDERERSENKLFDIVDRYGPVVDGYPSWHPLVTHHNDQCPETLPNNRCGYKGLDHTRYFLNAFVTCPYSDGQEIIDSVDALPISSVVNITAERLDVQFYQPNANPILVSCDWLKPLSLKGMIPASLAIPLMLQKEVPCWEWATCGETWESMRSYFLGSPHGSRSSLFVDQETALTMKKIWNLLINTGMFGPIKVSNQY
ncbi:MAG: hypothetical protein F6J86_41785 [Symploca sp. SIO1B1]|nr:hypothetical protein [Symploca sp. SIO1B1]